MEQTISDELGVPGYVVMYTTKTKTEWLKQARDAMDRAEKYGADTPNKMNQKDRKDLREALTALGQNPQF